MPNIELLFTVGGAVTAITVAFFTWIIALIKAQNKSVLKQVKVTSLIEKKIENHEIKIRHLESEVHGVVAKIEKLQGDIADIKTLVREDTTLIRGLMNSLVEIKQNQKELSKKIDGLV